ncbi:hypothetical protein CUT44_16595 [Streptomyces carminius]|uniref:Zinc finger DksA/TraR C4-type domain-containing protein n=1 Tax=Streptomyces carminius TaxID=2665496 RepID=A0A2M8LXJ0_9ACTN|nr:hypothetical protein [Streptomyces carminius]PJE96661.1 hypothetical protein CUT44_16595 [Streptomyces carminius]
MDNQVTGAAGARGAAGTGLTPRELAALRESLEEQRRFRLDQLRESGCPRPLPGDGRHTAGRAEVDARLTASARMVLTDVEAALERMDRGRYGRCERCVRPIPRQHLEIVPQARRCAACHRAGGAESTGEPRW